MMRVQTLERKSTWRMSRRIGPVQRPTWPSDAMLLLLRFSSTTEVQAVRFCRVDMLLLARLMRSTAGRSMRDASIIEKLLCEQVSEVSCGHTAPSLEPAITATIPLQSCLPGICQL